MNTLQTIMEQKGTPTLKAIAAVFDLPAVRLYSVAKQPKEGEIYDAKVFNWDAIERFVARRFDADLGIMSLEDVIDKALEIDVELKEKDGRRGSGGGGVAKIQVGDKMVPARKFPSFEMDSNAPIVLKKDPAVYKAVYQTITHTVLAPITADGEFASPEVKVISNLMLNYKGIAPTQLDEAVNARFNGEFVAE